jgi:hypothetical protein
MLYSSFSKCTVGRALEDMKKSDASDANKQNEMEKGVRSCPILEKGLKEKKEQKAS